VQSQREISALRFDIWVGMGYENACHGRENKFAQHFKHEIGSGIS